MTEEIKNIIEATSMGKLEKEAVLNSLLNLHSVSESCYGVFEPSGELVQLYAHEDDANKEKNELCETNNMKFFVREEKVV